MNFEIESGAYINSTLIFEKTSCEDKEPESIASTNNSSEVNSTHDEVKESVAHHSDKINSKRPKASYTCETCFKSFTRRYDLQRHMRIHTGEKPFTCETCLKSFSQKGQLRCHIRIHAGEKPYTCEICLKSFNTSGSLQRHMRIHTGEKPYICEICLNSFTWSGQLQYHMRIHTDEKRYTCQTCFNSFHHKHDFQRHLRIHTGDKPNTCHVCQKSFRWKGSLKIHMRIHTGEKPFSCEICLKSFTKNSHLQRHLRVHTGEKPYLCEFCQKSFDDCSTLRDHRRKNHELEKPCTNKVSLTSFPNHEEAHHSKTGGFVMKLSRESCKKSFVSHQTLKPRMSSHKEETPTDNEKFESLVSHSETEIASTECSRETSLFEKQSRNTVKTNFSYCHLLVIVQPCNFQSHSANAKSIGQDDCTKASVAPKVKMISKFSCSDSEERFSLRYNMYGCGICDDMFSTETEFLEHCTMNESCMYAASLFSFQ